MRMPKHRGLSLKRFVYSVPWHLFESYFQHLQPNAKPSAWAFLNPDVLEEFLNDPANAEASPVILEDFHRINDLSGRHMNLILRAYDRSGLAVDQDITPEALSMQLFLDDKEAFEYAWTLYLLLGTPTRVYEYKFAAGPLTVKPENISRLRANLQGWFGMTKKGTQCEVAGFEDADEVFVRISRGSYLKTIAKWRGNEIDFETFRPASEDVIAYKATDARLGIRCSVRRDREQYIRVFAEFIASDAALANLALNENAFSLTPIQDETFQYDGAGAISHVKLVEAHIRMPCLGEPTIVVKSDDVLRTLDEDVEGFSLRSGDLARVKLRFELRAEGDRRPRDVAIEIEPPSYSSLLQATYAREIEAYLRSQGVKLI